LKNKFKGAYTKHEKYKLWQKLLLTSILLPTHFGVEQQNFLMLSLASAGDDAIKCGRHIIALPRESTSNHLKFTKLLPAGLTHDKTTYLLLLNMPVIILHKRTVTG
jgi:hypothetical protein